MPYGQLGYVILVAIEIYALTGKIKLSGDIQIFIK
jgi:hypothetical protein